MARGAAKITEKLTTTSNTTTNPPTKKMISKTTKVTKATVIPKKTN